MQGRALELEPVEGLALRAPPRNRPLAPELAISPLQFRRGRTRVHRSPKALTQTNQHWMPLARAKLLKVRRMDQQATPTSERKISHVAMEPPKVARLLQRRAMPSRFETTYKTSLPDGQAGIQFPLAVAKLLWVEPRPGLVFNCVS